MKKVFVLSCLASAFLALEVEEIEVQGQAIELEMDGNLMGGYNKLPLEDAQNIRVYVETKLNDISDQKLVSYQKQVVNGFNHRLVYEDKNGEKTEVIVYENIEGRLSLPIVSPMGVEEM